MVRCRLRRMLHHFQLQHHEKGSASAMRVEGELDIAAAPHLRRVIGDLMGTGVRDVTVDLSRAAFVDSSGLGALLWAEHRLRAVGGDLAVVNPSPSVQRTIELAGLDELLMH